MNYKSINIIIIALTILFTIIGVVYYIRNMKDSDDKSLAAPKQQSPSKKLEDTKNETVKRSAEQDKDKKKIGGKAPSQTKGIRNNLNRKVQEQWEAEKRYIDDQIYLKNNGKQLYHVKYSAFSYNLEPPCCHKYNVKRFIADMIKSNKTVGPYTKVPVTAECCKKEYTAIIAPVYTESKKLNYPPPCNYFAKYFQLNPMKYVVNPDLAYIYNGFENVFYKDTDYKPLMKIMVMPETTDLDIRHYAKHIFLAIVALHKREIVIGSIKPWNILIDSNKRVKLFDFSFAAKLDSGYNMTPKEKLSLNVSSPEYLEGDAGPTKQNDWWAFGITLYYMYMEEYPFYVDTALINHRLLLIEAIKKEEPLKFFTYVPEDAKDLITRLLKYNGKDRIIKREDDLEEIIKHPYFKDSNLKEELKKAFYY